MHRRTFVASGLATVTPIAGCLGDDDGGGTTESQGSTVSEGATAGGSATATADASGDGDYPVPESELSRGAPKDGIPAIVDPAFAADWSGIELSVTSRFGGERTITPRLEDDDEVIGIERDGEARAYPLRVLNWHEVCNDDFGVPLLVTYCPLCRTGVVAERRVNGRTTRFGVSGLLWKSNLVMYDELTESLWSQVAATAIRGEKAGTMMDLAPSTITTWGEWRDAHPGSTVLRPPPESNTVRGPDATRDYDSNPYTGYDTSDRVGLGRSDYDDRLHPKVIVVGVVADGEARAFPFPAVEAAGVVNDTVGDLDVVVTLDAGGSLAAYDRTVDGRSITFEADTAKTIAGGGSTWRRSTGRAVDGPYDGTTLDRANDRSPMFWFSWADIHEDTDIYDPG